MAAPPGLRRALGAAALAVSLAACGAPPEQRDLAPGGAVSLAAAIADVEAGRRATPLIGAPAASGDATVTFLARRIDGRVPRVVSDVTGWGEHVDGTFDFGIGVMTQVEQTEWYALQATVAPRARIEYQIAYAPGDYRLDPHNPRQSDGPRRKGARASEFVMPGYTPPPDLADTPTVPQGSITSAIVGSRSDGGSWRVVMYLPPDHRAERTYPLAVFLDLRADLLAPILDRMIARRAIPPIVAAFVGPVAFTSGHAAEAATHTFLIDDLPAWMSARDGRGVGVGPRAILGISFGAKDALDVALASAESSHPFNGVGLLIPGRRIDRAAIDALARRRGGHLRATILAGRYDQANIETARGLREALTTAGHRVDYIEVPEGHSAVTWSDHVPEVLASLFGHGG